MCHKHRKVERHDDDGRPLCTLCAVGDRRDEVRETDERYWRENLLRRHAALERHLETDWCKTLLDEFVAHQVARIPAMRLSLGLERHVRDFRKLESRFGSREEINTTNLLERYDTEEMRRAQSLLEFLRTIGVDVPTRDQGEDLAEERRMNELLEGMRDSKHAKLLERFHASLSEPNLRGQISKPHSRRMSLKAACGMVQVAGDEALCQAVLDTYLRKVPGQRAAVSRFVGYLSRVAGFDIVLPPERASKANRFTKHAGDKALSCCLRHLGEDMDFIDLRAAVAGILVGLWGLPLAKVIRLERRAVTKRADGFLMIDLADDEPLGADPRIAPGLSRYLGLRDELVGDAEGFLFPGRPLSQHVNEGTISSRLKAWGASTWLLGMSARHWIKARAADSESESA